MNSNNISDGGAGDFFIRKFGRNDDLDSGTVPEDIWDFGGLYPFPSAVAATTIASDQAADTGAGTGMQQAQVIGLDTNYLLASEDATLNGLTPVALSTQFLRVHRVFGTAFGSGGTNAGNVDVLHGATVLARIIPARGQTLMCIFTTPADWPTVRVVGGYASIGRQAAAFAEVIMFTRDFGSGGWRDRLTVDIHSQGFDFISGQDDRVTEVTIDPRTDIRLTGQSVSANNTGISAAFVLSNK